MKSQERRLQILLMLQSGRKQLNVDYLAERFNVSRRTIFRDLNFITDMDVPIAHDLNSGYSIPKSYSIPPLMFNDREISVIRVGLSFIESQSNTEMKEAAKSVAIKIESVLPTTLKPLYWTMENSVIVDPVRNRREGISGEGEWYIISAAISNNNSILFRYKGSGKIRDVNPYLLVYYGDHWNLIGYDKGRGGFRNFRLEFISDIEVNDTKFEKDENLVATYLFKGSEDSELSEVVVKVHSSIWGEFYRTIPAEITDKKSDGEYFVVTFSFDSMVNLDRLLMRYSEFVIPLHPIELVSLRKDRLTHMIGQMN
jgi:predicted DNA-binding transcriptional regulator YafY